jgi:hypothetical protein
MAGRGLRYQVHASRVKLSLNKESSFNALK